MSVRNPLGPAWLDPAQAAEWGEVWPQTAGHDDSGALVVGGVAAGRLVEEYGTPLYVVDEHTARSRAARIKAAFEDAFAPLGVTVRLYYAGKAFLSIQSARWMAEEGLGIDACTGGELAVALACGIEPSRVGLHGNNKSDTEIDAAVRAGIGTVVLDSVAEIDRVARAARRHGRIQNVRLRVNSGVHAHTHEFLATAHEDQKFGVSLAQAPEAARLIRQAPSLHFLGLHGHIGSQIFAAAGFAEAARRLVRLHARLSTQGRLPQLNLGGGFGIAYTGADRPAPIEEIARDIAQALARECEAQRIPPPDVAFEPGRWIIGPAGITLYRVGAVKDVQVGLPGPDAAQGGPGAQDESGPQGGSGAAARSAVRRYVSVDGGMSDNVRPALYGADYTVRLAGRRSAAAPVLVRVAGRHCESGDIVVPADYLPGDVGPGDIVAVAATGAYCWSLSSNYNYVGIPPVVAVRDGRSRVIIRGESLADLMARNVDAGAGDPGPGSPAGAGREEP